MVAWKLFTATVLVLGGAIGQHPDEALLRRGDIGAFAPESFRARLVLTSQPSKTRHEIEVWRSGAAKTLVRMLDPKERGKFLLRLDDDMWFVSSTAKKPLRLRASGSAWREPTTRFGARASVRRARRRGTARRVDRRRGWAEAPPGRSEYSL